jgi:sugar lactone lactonase YvrE
MKTYLSSAVLILALCVGVSAQSTLASLFDTYTVTNRWAQLPAGQTFEASTSSVAADGKGSVVVLVRAAPYFRVFSRDGQPVKQWGDAGLFKLAHSVHFGPDGSLWATDPNAHVVYQFSPEGAIVMTLGTKDVSGDNASRTSFNEPNAVTVSANGDIYVSDGYKNARVVHFTKDGTFVKEWGRKGSRPGELSEPHTIAMDSRGRLFVGDRENNRIQIFDQSGRYLEEWRQYGRPSGIVITSDDTIYVADSESWGTDTGARELPGIKKGRSA